MGSETNPSSHGRTVEADACGVIGSGHHAMTTSISTLPTTLPPMRWAPTAPTSNTIIVKVYLYTPGTNPSIQSPIDKMTEANPDAQFELVPILVFLTFLSRLCPIGSKPRCSRINSGSCLWRERRTDEFAVFGENANFEGPTAQGLELCLSGWHCDMNSDEVVLFDHRFFAVGRLHTRTQIVKIRTGLRGFDKIAPYLS